jgi:hypothetical protein
MEKIITLMFVMPSEKQKKQFKLLIGGLAQKFT